MTYYNCIRIAAVLGALAVAFGAFGAHALANLLEEQGREDTYDTAVKYHFYHSLAVLMTGILIYLFPDSRKLKISAWLFLFGIVVFSGSLYLLCLSGITWLGAITPLGGTAFIIGWLFLFLGIKFKQQ
ncbi:DUF423 domain-containing protein [Negadavirga shengliensis]|uniref:DUF423 domain-containing protein n=1 Tax=Negadavirga shengliensis TaxID=1389218 RepID=A0ABV9T5R4_9BACT